MISFPGASTVPHGPGRTHLAGQTSHARQAFLDPVNTTPADPVGTCVGGVAARRGHRGTAGTLWDGGRVGEGIIEGAGRSGRGGDGSGGENVGMDVSVK